MTVVFAYAFPHKKTQDGLFRMLAAGQVPSLVVAAPWRKLNFPAAEVRTALRGHAYVTAEQICRSFGIPYVELDHDSQELLNLLRSSRPEHGLVLGARVLREQIVEAFQVGILNLHPGLLPENRGLDTVKWAVVKGVPQGVTAHVIDSRVDRGTLLFTKETPVFSDDNLLEVTLRVQDTELSMLNEALERLHAADWVNGPELGVGEYHRAMTPTEEAQALSQLPGYLERFAVHS